jgi:hypothetical protein
MSAADKQYACLLFFSEYLAKVEQDRIISMPEGIETGRRQNDRA